MFLSKWTCKLLDPDLQELHKSKICKFKQLETRKQKWIKFNIWNRLTEITPFVLHYREMDSYERENMYKQFRYRETDI